MFISSTIPSVIINTIDSSLVDITTSILLLHYLDASIRVVYGKDWSWQWMP